MNPEGAQPYATISVYGDLVESKGLGLIRGDITPNLTKKVRRGLVVTIYHGGGRPGFGQNITDLFVSTRLQKLGVIYVALWTEI